MQSKISALAPHSVETAQPVMTGSPLRLLALFAWLSLCSLIVFWEVFPLSYALDDMDQLAVLATMRSGHMPFYLFLLRPHNEHLVPLLRLLFWAATWVSGIDALAARITVLLVHVAGAMACALLTSYVSRNRLAPWLAGTMYAGAAGFAGSVVWEITIACFSISAMLLYFALVAVARPSGHGKAALSASLALVLASCGGMPGAAIAAMSIPAYILIANPKLAWGRWRAMLAYLLLSILILLGASLNLRHWGVSPTLRLSGLLGGGWLILTAAFRFLMAWIPLPDGELAQSPLRVAGWSVVAWAILLISSYWLEKKTKNLLIALWAGDCVFVLLIGLGRSDFSLFELFVTDRYYYFFLLPLSIQAGAVAALWISRLTARNYAAKPLVAFVVVFLIAAGLVGSREKLHQRILWTIWELHKKALLRGKALVHLAAARASVQHRSRDLLLSDGGIPFDGVHKDRIAFSTLFFAEFPKGVPGVKWLYGEPGIPSIDASVENQLLDEWSQAFGTASPVCVVNGTLQDVRAIGWVDFGKGAFDHAIVRGFHAWERPFRWMTRSGTVRLKGDGGALVIRAQAPLSLLRKKWPDLRSLRAEVHVDSRWVGEITITREEEQEFHISLPAETQSRLSPTHPIDVTLRSELTWTGADVHITDDRELSLALDAIGFLPPSQGTPESASTCSERFSKKESGH
jgi:hypothetical protein